MPTPILQPRADASVCVQCRKKFAAGDRVTTAFIVTGVGRNSETKEFGAYLSDQFEMAHISCGDPQLTGKLIING